ncbi:MAG: hypothetical protein GY818_15950 [Planctomycetaceae bacterium]|nr:hypothetical protein [Planctomycetaceae bacterium]
MGWTKGLESVVNITACCYSCEVELSDEISVGDLASRHALGGMFKISSPECDGNTVELPGMLHHRAVCGSCCETYTCEDEEEYDEDEDWNNEN